MSEESTLTPAHAIRQQVLIDVWRDMAFMTATTFEGGRFGQRIFAPNGASSRAVEMTQGLQFIGRQDRQIAVDARGRLRHRWKNSTQWHINEGIDLLYIIEECGLTVLASLTRDFIVRVQPTADLAVSIRLDGLLHRLKRI